MQKESDFAKALANVLANEDKVFTASALAGRFANVEVTHRHDSVVRTIADIYTKLAEKEPSRVVSAKEVKELYDETQGLSSTLSSFTKDFADVLPPTDKDSIDKEVVAEKIRHPYVDTIRTAEEAKQDKIEVSEHDDAMYQVPEELHELIGKKQTEKLASIQTHNKSIVDLGRLLITSELNALGITNTKVEPKLSNSDYILYLVSFGTTKGTQRIDVPIEVKQSIPLLPTIFIGKTGSFQFSREGVNGFLEQVKNNEEEEKERLASMQRNAFYDDASRTNNTNTMEVGEGDETTPKAKMPEELKDLEGALLDSVLRKNSEYDNDTIERGRTVIESELISLGFPHTQIRFAGDDSDKALCYEATVQVGKHKADVTIPLEVRNNNLCFPSHFVAKAVDKKYELSTNGFNKLIEESSEELTPVKYSSAFLEMDYNSLRKTVHQAANDKRHEIAEEALNVIKDKFGSDTHAKVVGEYQTWLTEASENVTERCTGCAYYDSTHSVHASDFCNLLSLPCNKIKKDAKANICVKKNVEWDRLTDDSYKGIMSTSRIAMT